ncbi:phosphotransferase [Viridibacillus sp. YIM B01967]|uniref:Phosphotransferase n=1 Tax=Viridibacillus soli TaxID=2798301 RepID=A0ABS1H1X7_9BACL|nr:phosphotransferase [Viridibacillus soli]MBK3493419.1 phosphotransferase [Viridibacillus soli]
MNQSGTFRRIKPNVWQWTINGHNYSIKRYANKTTADKIRIIHQQLKKVKFPNILPVIASDDPATIVQPWVSNVHSAKFSRVEERTKTLELLYQLHATNNDINWSELGVFFPQYNLQLKWHDRLLKFQAKREQIAKFLGAPAVDQLIIYAEQALKSMKFVKNSKPTILHGDVVHHNFLMTEQGKLYLIDFDLAAVGHAEDEIIMWMHRVLPHVDYNLPKLLEEQPLLRGLPKERLLAVRYPNELLREWLYVDVIATQRKKAFIEELVAFTHVALSSWPKLWYDSGSLK